VVIAGLLVLMFSFDVVLATVSLFIVGLGYAGLNVIFPTLMADVIDKDELETGSRREGAYFGSAAFFTKPAQSIAQGMVALVFFLTNYDQEASTQEPLARIGVMLTISLIPAIFLVLGLLFTAKFPLDSSTDEYKAMKKRVEKLHDEKLAKLKSTVENAERSGPSGAVEESPD
jgi:Na+/melibiose symporter-like transporter